MAVRGPSFDLERVAHYDGKTTTAGRSICCYSCCIRSQKGELLTRCGHIACPLARSDCDCHGGSLRWTALRVSGCAGVLSRAVSRTAQSTCMLDSLQAALQ